MTDPTRTAYVYSHLEELRSEAEQERLAALGRTARRGCPGRAGLERLRHRDRRPAFRTDAAVRPSSATGGRS